MVKTFIRQAVSSDFPTLLSIDKASFPPGIAYDSSELSYFMRRDGAHTLVAEVDGEIVGFILMDILPRRKLATVVTLDVPEQYRRQGHATSLLNSAEEVLQNNGIARCELQVDVNNEGAIEFYTKHGFEKIRPLPNYYSNGHDAYLMAKRLA